MPLVEFCVVVYEIAGRARREGEFRYRATRRIVRRGLVYVSSIRYKCVRVRR